MVLQARAVQKQKVALERSTLKAMNSTSVHIISAYSLISTGTEVSTINGAIARFHKGWSDDYRLFGDHYGSLKEFPVSLGYSCVGKVANIGSEVTQVKEGDYVWLDRPHQTEFVVSENEAVQGLCVPGVDPRRYTFRVLAKVALAAVHDARPYIGATALVTGLGVVGQLTAQLLKANGVSRIFATDICDKRRQVAAAQGVEIIDPVSTNVAEYIKQNTKETGVDFAIEASTNFSALDDCIRSVSVGGRVVTLSTYTGQANALNLGEEYHRNRVELISSMSVNECPHRGFPQWSADRLIETTRKLLDAGVIEPEKSLLTKEVNFSDIPQLYSELCQGKSNDVGIIIKY
ncbi:zinc-binding alcohol dehydrogenase [Serratia rubidaea]|nr:zinc-binding alcohol dehydrogenase [Serratia rubidaea]